MGEKERTIRSALSSWPRTARLTLLYIVSGGMPTTLAIVAFKLLGH